MKTPEMKVCEDVVDVCSIPGCENEVPPMNEVNIGVGIAVYFPECPICWECSEKGLVAPEPAKDWMEK